MFVSCGGGAGGAWNRLIGDELIYLRDSGT